MCVRSFIGLFLSFGMLLVPTLARAQFIQTDLSTYQLADPKREVAIIVTEKGLFISYAPKRSGTLSGYDVKRLTTKNSHSLFIGYGAANQVPEKLFLPGAGNEFRIRGTFSVYLSSTIRVAVAVNTNSTPYITIVNLEKGQYAIIGFVGRQLVLNLSGTAAVDLFEADPLRREYSTLAASYHVGKDDQLYSLGNPVAGNSSIGLFSPAEHPCLAKDRRFVWDQDLAPLLQINPKPAGLKQKIRAAAKGLSLDEFLVLNISQEFVVGVSYDSGKFVAINAQEPEGVALCVAKILDLKK